MGNSARGKLAYGYDLGGGEEWKIQGLGEWGQLPALDWYDQEAEDGSDFQSAAEKRLLAEVVGFAETDWRADRYFDREREAKAQLGVRFEMYCSGDYPAHLLTVRVMTAEWGEVEAIDMAALAKVPAREGWDDRLRVALTTLGITPTQKQAQWLLCSFWG